MMKTCSERKPANSTSQYSRKELDTLARAQLGLNTTELRKLSKKELCKRLSVEWQQTTAKKNAIEPKTMEKLCTDKACTRSFPNRYTKPQLVAIVHERFPKYSMTALRLMSIKKLCTLLKKPVMKCPGKGKTPSATQDTALSNKIGAFSQTQTSAFKGLKNKSLSCIQRSSFPLRQHQKRVIEYFEKHRGLIAYHTVGTGKTLTAITISQCFLDKNPDYKVYVVTPASLVQNFKKQMMDYKNILYADRYRFFSIQKFVSLYKKGLVNCEKILLIVDEAHNLKTLYKKSAPKAGGKKPTEVGINSKYVERCAQKASKVLLLTGTPVTNSPKDIISLYNMIRDADEPRLVTKQKDIGVNQKTYTTNLLLEKMKCKISVFDEKSPDFYPVVKEHEIFLVMTPSYQEKYDKLLDESGLSDLAIKMFGEIDINSFYNGVRRAVNTLEDKESPKIRWALRQIQKGRKTIVFSHFLEAGNKAIIKNLPVGTRYAYINGSLPQKERAEIVNQYNSNQIKVLFISKAGGEGLDLKGTQDIIILEPAWNLSVEEQVIGRGVRYKSHIDLPVEDRRVDVYRLYLLKSSDKVQQTLAQQQQKQELRKSGSIDLIMRYLIHRKEKQLDLFRRQLKEISVEESFCD